MADNLFMLVAPSKHAKRPARKVGGDMTRELCQTRGLLEAALQRVSPR